jgi:hypothetical protein
MVSDRGVSKSPGSWGALFLWLLPCECCQGFSPSGAGGGEWREQSSTVLTTQVIKDRQGQEAVPVQRTGF